MPGCTSAGFPAHQLPRARYTPQEGPLGGSTSRACRATPDADGSRRPLRYWASDACTRAPTRHARAQATLARMSRGIRSISARVPHTRKAPATPIGTRTLRLPGSPSAKRLWRRSRPGTSSRAALAAPSAVADCVRHARGARCAPWSATPWDAVGSTRGRVAHGQKNANTEPGPDPGR